MGGGRQLTGRIWRTALLLASLTALGTSLLTAPATAKGPAAGRLDPSFGTGGKTAVAFPAAPNSNVGVKYDLPFQFTAGELKMVASPGGKTVVAGSTRIARLLANGKPDRQFGSGGMAAIPGLPGRTFVLAAAAVDSLGRVLVAGSARPLPTESTPDPLLSSAAVMRFGANGSLDTSFGDQGVLITDFGIKAPEIGPTRYKGAAVGLRSIAVDSQNRPLLTGGFVAKITYCSGPQVAISTAFVARLTETGSQDPSFGDNGLRQVADFSSFGQGSLLPGGSLLAVGAAKPRCEGGGPPVVLTGFNSSGSLDPSFGFAGFRTVGFDRPPALTVSPAGKIVLLGAPRSGSQLVMRLLSNGGVDPGFGRVGRVYIDLRKGDAFEAVAVDGRGRLLFAGHSSRRVTKKARNPLRRSTFLLARMVARGGFDRSFGPGGAVRTGFGGPSSSAATQVTVDSKERILVGGSISTPRLATGGGFALARYLSEPAGRR
jgi:uncharacterized delta-60 repeat protein